MNLSETVRNSHPHAKSSRRRLLQQAGVSAGWWAGLGLVGDSPLRTTAAAAVGSAGGPPSPADLPHISPRARRMVLLFQHGGPSQIDLFDPKPALQKYAGQPVPGGVEAFFDKQDSSRCAPSPFRFSRYGSCGMEFSELLPSLARCADEVCMVRSLHTLVNDHEGAIRHLQTGKTRIGRPTMGAWIAYALGTRNPDLPPYIVLSDPNHDQVDGIRNWSAGFLPPAFQGTPIRSDGPALFDLAPAAGVTPEMQRAQLDLLQFLNHDHRARYPHLGELDARIASNALAYNIRYEIAEAMDVTQETTETQNLYGMDRQETGTYSRRCLMARRLLERGVPFVAVFNDSILGDPWDTHFDHNGRTRKVAANVDPPSAGLILDLKRRGMLEDTIVLWIGEFGRLPVAQSGDGRDHNRHAFTALIAGGGFRPGLVYGATDEFGYRVAEKPVAVGELHATILQQFGLDHTLLTWPHEGRDESLTDADITGVVPVDALVA